MLHQLARVIGEIRVTYDYAPSRGSNCYNVSHIVIVAYYYIKYKSYKLSFARIMWK